MELPLAAAVIVAGMGSAAVQIIATATLGAMFGFGGLGTYLTEGIAQNDDAMMFSGVVLVALLALSAEAHVHAARPRPDPARRPVERAASTRRQAPSTSAPDGAA